MYLAASGGDASTLLEPLFKAIDAAIILKVGTGLRQLRSTNMDAKVCSSFARSANSSRRLSKSAGPHRDARQPARPAARASERILPGIIGYDETVLPEIENGVLAGHHMIFLGERGQAKSRIIRLAATLLDEHVPAVKGCEINDDPFAPICGACRRAARPKAATSCEIAWIGREQRYAEKLATPDVSVADLIGEIDPIKVAEGRYLADEETIHYGLIPRTNRGIFAINELPDLTEKVQVGLFNLMEEKDVQIKGYKIRLPLDVVFVASANPEDYTSRGRIITPLKDRFDIQIRTHYPQDDRARNRDHGAGVRAIRRAPGWRCGCRNSSRRSSRKSPSRRAPPTRSIRARACPCG